MYLHKYLQAPFIINSTHEDKFYEQIKQEFPNELSDNEFVDKLPDPDFLLIFQYIANASTLNK